MEPDEGLANHLRHFLERAGFEVFIDTQIEIGTRWAEEIESQITSSHYFVVLLSTDSIRSDMVRHEVKLATGSSASCRRIFPIRVGFDGELPCDLGAWLNPVQHVSWEVGQSFQLICEQILLAIQNDRPLPGPTRAKDVDPSEEGLKLLAEVIENNGAPLPVVDRRLETGTIKPNSQFYVRRAEDDRLEGYIAVKGETIIVKAPRQYGKSSLLARAHALSHRAGQKSCYIDFQMMDELQLANLDGLCRILAHKIARELKLSKRPTEFWDESLGSKESLEFFLEEGVLNTLNSPVILCLDEVDRIFDKNYRDDFFAAVRAWHNKRATSPLWMNLSLYLAHSTEPTLWIRDINISPFNVGERLRLPPFSLDNVADLNRRHRNPLSADKDVVQLWTFLGGQPFLIRQALYWLSSNCWTLPQLMNVATAHRGPFGDHLRANIWVLRRNEASHKALRKILDGGGCDDEMEFEKLLAAGMIKGDSRQEAEISCELYRRYLREHL